jgi:hypothetical protein
MVHYEAAAEIGPKLVELNILTPKQAIRMHDAEFLTELAIVLENGIVNKSEKSLSHIYKMYDKDFPREREFRDRIYEFVELLNHEFAPLKNTFITKSYVCHSLFCALMQKKYGIPNADNLGIQTSGVFFTDLNKTLDALAALAGAHELQDTNGAYREYVEACMSTTHQSKHRTIRTAWLGKALI